MQVFEICKLAGRRASAATGKRASEHIRREALLVLCSTCVHV